MLSLGCFRVTALTRPLARLAIHDGPEALKRDRTRETPERELG